MGGDYSRRKKIKSQGKKKIWKEQITIFEQIRQKKKKMWTEQKTNLGGKGEGSMEKGTTKQAFGKGGRPVQKSREKKQGRRGPRGKGPGEGIRIPPKNWKKNFERTGRKKLRKKKTMRTGDPCERKEGLTKRCRK